MTASLYDDVTTPHHSTRYWKHPVLSATSDTITKEPYGVIIAEVFTCIVRLMAQEMFS